MHHFTSRLKCLPKSLAKIALYRRADLRYCRLVNREERSGLAMAFTIRAIGYKGADIGLTTRFPAALYDRLCALKKRTRRLPQLPPPAGRRIRPGRPAGGGPAAPAVTGQKSRPTKGGFFLPAAVQPSACLRNSRKAKTMETTVRTATINSDMLLAYSACPGDTAPSTKK